MSTVKSQYESLYQARGIIMKTCRSSRIPCFGNPGQRHRHDSSPCRSGGQDVVFRGSKIVDSRHFIYSGLSHPAHLLALYASQRPLLERHATLASGWWLTFTGRDFHPGLLRKVSGHRHFPPPCLSFLGARNLGEVFSAVASLALASPTAFPFCALGSLHPQMCLCFARLRDHTQHHIISHRKVS